MNISYNFMTPIDEDRTRYFWFQHRNTDPGNRAISERMNAGARAAFEEDPRCPGLRACGDEGPNNTKHRPRLDAGGQAVPAVAGQAD